jgi:polysaccharide chain length determinant protein (PEP-CTERM system associated)
MAAVDVRQYLEIPFRRPKYILIPLVLVITAAVTAAFVLPKKYRSSTQILVESQKVPDRLVQNAGNERNRRLQTLNQEILSRTRLEQVIQELQPYPRDPEVPLTVVVDGMRSAITIRVRGNDAFSVEYVHKDPAMAQAVANRLVTLFIQESTQARERSVVETARFIDSRLLESRKELEAKEEGLRRFKEQHIGTLPEQLPANLATLQRLQLEQQSAAADLRSAQSRLAAAEAATPAAPARGQEDPELAQLRAELVSLRTRYTEEHPDVQVLRSRIARLEAAQPAGSAGPGTTAPVSAAAQQARLEVKTLQARQQDVERRAAALEARVDETPRTEQALLVLTRDYEKLKENYLALLNKKMGARMAENLEKEWSGDRFRILDPANFPDRPFFPNLLLFLMGGVLGGLALGLAAGFAVEFLDHSVKTAAEVETLLGLPILASVHHIEVPAALAAQAAAWTAHARPATLRQPVQVDAAIPEPAPDAPPAVDDWEPPATEKMPARHGADQLRLLTEDEGDPEPALTTETRTEAPSPTPAVVEEPAPPAEEPASEEAPPPTVEEPARVVPAEPAAAAQEPAAVLEKAPEPPAPPPPVVPKWEEPEPVADPTTAEAFVPEGFNAAPAPVVEEERPRAFRAPEPAVAAYQATPVREAQVEAEPGGTAISPRLTAEGGAAHGLFLDLDRPGERVLGRAPRCDLRLDMGNVDPVHAHVSSSARGVFISDAGSARGTFVNGRRIKGAQALRANDQIFLGPPSARQSALLVFTTAEIATPEAAPAPEPAVAPVERASLPEAVPVEAPPEVPPSVAVAPAAVAVAPAVAAPPAELPAPQHPPPAPAVSAPMKGAAARPAAGTQFRAPFVSPGPRAAAPVKKTRRRAVIAATAVALLVGGVVGVRATLNPPPVVSSVTPFRAAPGQAVTLVGTGFRTAATVVRFGEDVAEVTSTAPSRLVVTVPKGAKSGDAPITVEQGGHRTSPVPFKVASIPRVSRVEPSVALPGQEVTLVGAALRGDFTVYVGGQRAEVLSTEPERLRLRVPPSLPLTEGARVPITFESTEDLSTPAALYLGHLPLLLEAHPVQGESGARVTLRGLGFTPEAASTLVTFGGREALVFKSQPEEIVVAAPSAGALSGQVETEIRVSTRGVASASHVPFTLVRPAAEMFVPRFFPAPVSGHLGHDHALVSTELGPVLLLTGPAGGLSAAERAERAANLMNGLAESAAEPLVLEARAGAEPGVALAGGATSVVSATPSDAAGYFESSGGRQQAPSPANLALFWTALLKDHLALFVAGHRPTHLVELSSRGQAMLDLYGASLQQGRPRGGVPASVVTSLSSSLAEAFRTMALTLPTAGQPIAGAAVAGRWVGSMEQDDAGTLPVEIRLAVDRNRLRGTLAMVAQPRGVRLETSLDSPSYSKGAVSFRMTLRGRPLVFKGTFRDETMSGTLASASRPDHPVGFITVRYAN